MNKNKGTNQPMSELDELILDRLVDNDLTDAEYQQVLRLVEEKPDGWRRLAVAFLESQAFEKEMNLLHSKGDLLAGESNGSRNHVGEPQPLNGPDSVNELDSAEGHDSSGDEWSEFDLGVVTDDKGSSDKISATGARASNRGSTQSGTGSVTSKASVYQPRTNSHGNWDAWKKTIPAIVACFFIAFAAGLYVREFRKPGPTELGELGSNRTPNGQTTVDPEFIELVSNDSSRPVQTPVYNHQKFDPGQYAKDVDDLRPKLQDLVEKSGWHADERTHVVPIKDRTGNKIIVPLKEIKLTPKKFEGYQ